MEDSLAKRYIIKLVSTFLVVAINLIVQMILPRAFTVEEYANYSYNMNIFSSVISISFLSADGAFVSKLSKRLKETGLIRFYGKFVLCIVVVVNLGISILFFSGGAGTCFSNQIIETVLLAFNAAMLAKVLQEITSMFDCYTYTRFSEPMVLCIKISISILVYIVYAVNLLNLHMFYTIQILVLSIGCLLMIIFFAYRNKEVFLHGIDKSTKNYVKEFAVYCKPLIFANIFVNIMLMFSNWLLKGFGGDTEQAYFGAAWQLNTLVIYAVTPIVVLLQREFAVRMQNKEALCSLYQRMVKLVFIVVGFVAGCVIVNADYVLAVAFGEQYMAAQNVTILIMLYTIYQAWGQVNGSMYIASERSSVYAKIITINYICSFILILIFQIPNFIWPSGLGAIGIGLQKLFDNMISVLMLGYINCRYLKIRFADNYIKMHGYLLAYLAVGYGIRELICRLFLGGNFEHNYLLLLFINVIVYGSLWCMVFVMYPNILGIDIRLLVKQRLIASNKKGK